ncbi:MAG TPA: ABC transporter permease [Thermodesulfobacteriota bacterium]|nr:ABC transporter permease [Thermodesulfobacteriota bacterium]
MVKFLLFFQLAFKNLRRFRRRTLLVGLTVFLCAAVLVFNNSLGNGIEDQLLKNLVMLQTGHLQVSPQPAETSGGAPIYWQTLPPALLEFIGSHPDRLAFHPRLETAVLIQARGQTITRAFLMGLEPDGESPFLDSLLPIREGLPFSALMAGAIVLSEEYARRLKVMTGETVTVTVHTRSSGTRMMDLRLSGIFKNASPWQEFLMFTPLSSVQDLLEAPGQVSSLRVVLKDPGRIERMKAELLGVIRQNHLSWGVKDFRETGGFSLGIIQANRFSILLMNTLLLAVTAIGISLLVLLSLQLRLPELRVLSLLGTSPGWIRIMVLQESLLLGLIFGSAGALLGLGFSAYFHSQGISVQSLPLSYLLGTNKLIPTIRPAGIVRVMLLMLGLCILSAWVPIWSFQRYGLEKRRRYA